MPNFFFIYFFDDADNNFSLFVNSILIDSFRNVAEHYSPIIKIILLVNCKLTWPLFLFLLIIMGISLQLKTNKILMSWKIQILQQVKVVNEYDDVRNRNSEIFRSWQWIIELCNWNKFLLLFLFTSSHNNFPLILRMSTHLRHSKYHTTQMPFINNHISLITHQQFLQSTMFIPFEIIITLTNLYKFSIKFITDHNAAHIFIHLYHKFVYWDYRH